MKKINIFGIITIILFLAIAACGPSVYKISMHGNRYDGKNVRVKGKVINTLHLDDLNYFVIKRGKYHVNVVTNDFLPVLNDNVTVRGKIISKFYYQRDTIVVIKENTKAKKSKDNIFNKSVR